MTTIESREEFIALLNATCTAVAPDMWMTADNKEVRVYAMVWAVDRMGDLTGEYTEAGRFEYRRLITDLIYVYHVLEDGTQFRMFTLGPWEGKK